MPDRFEAEKGERIAAARALLAGDGDGAAFAAILFGGAAGEDLLEYSAENLADIARAAFAFLEKRTEPAKIRVFDVASPDWKGRLSTAVEIVTTDRPFILDSVLGELQAGGHPAKLVLHPILPVVREGDGRLVAFGDAATGGAVRESVVHVHILPIADPADRQALEGQLESLMDEVRLVTDDWRAMRRRLAQAIADFRTDPEHENDDETVAFLEWLDANFTFFGMREFSYRNLDDAAMEDAQGEGLGLLRLPGVRVLRRGNEAATITPQMREFLLGPEPLIVTKADFRARVHRRDYIDLIGVKRFDPDGGAVGELRIVGLFTSASFTHSVQTIPLVRRKVARVVERAGFDPVSHSGKALLQILETYPRTELFQADEDSLYDAAMAILQLEERPRVRVLSRRDRFDRFVSVLVFVPRDRYSSDLRNRLGAELARLYDGRFSAFTPDLSSLTLARVQFIIGRNPGTGPEPAQPELEARVRAMLRGWADDLGEVLVEAWPGGEAEQLRARYGDAFGPEYQAAFEASVAASDIRVAEGLGSAAPDAVAFSGRDDPAEPIALRFHHLGSPVPLSERVPLLENLGFAVVDERTYRIEPKGGTPVYLHDMTLAVRGGAAFDPAEAGERLAAAVLAIRHGSVENDGFNALVLTAGLSWREANVLRAVGRYLRQTDLPFSIDYLWAALQRYPAIAAELFTRFAARFDPAAADRDAAEAAADTALGAALESVASLDDDTILRAFASVIQAAQRTDFYAVGPDGQPLAGVALKLQPGELAFVPAPRPFREIFVLEPQVEGLHMRFGPVARGGLRWSDRPQDYRLEVLGLVKAQQIKNAVIVPVGAKGGFVPLRQPEGGSREDLFEAGRQSYIAFVDRLLALTDDLDGDTVVPPADTVRHDPDDPYLVVAADKGTATFSDTANAVAVGRGFWLGDAFASGGSAGYDHKAMGITARGAWEAVKRHFREMDRDIQEQPFTCVGVGDMSGDVFGNGMLLSGQTRLLAAFDHRDIFIDPDPDPARSLAERQRLFALPRSSWQDYDKALISAGGGVFSRRDKQVPLSPEAKALLGLEADAPRPTEVIAAILRARVDLLWFGGIGTYVRGPDETDAEVGDKANDAVRITADAIGAKVVGEGANLGMTPRARVAYSARGGRCNSDAIDNSAGVNCSDVEVNIKIALSPAVRAGKIDTEARNALLKSMTDDVAALVLRNNYLQPLALSLEERRGIEALGTQSRLIRELEATGLLDRRVENLPDDAGLAERVKAREPLTRPEIATLLAFAKIALGNDIVASDLPDDPYLDDQLAGYFPEEMQERFRPEIEAHRLRREIIATRLSNSLVNRCGPTLLSDLHASGAGSAAVTRAYWITRDSFGMDALHAAVDALDNRIPGQLQLELYGIVQAVTVDRTAWFVRNLRADAPLAETIRHYRDGLSALAENIADLASGVTAGGTDAAAARFGDAGVPAELAARLARLPLLAEATDVVLIADETGHDLADVARDFFAVGDRFHFAGVEAMLAGVRPADQYEAMALQQARESLGAAHRDLVRSVLRSAAGGDLDGWDRGGGERAGETARQVGAILAEGNPTSAKGTVAASLLADLARRVSAEPRAAA